MNYENYIRFRAVVLRACHSLSADGCGADLLKQLKSGEVPSSSDFSFRNGRFSLPHLLYFTQNPKRERVRSMKLPFQLTKKHMIIGAGVAVVVIFITVIFCLVFGQVNQQEDHSQTESTNSQTVNTTVAPIESSETTVPTETTVQTETTQPEESSQSTETAQPAETSSPSEPEDDPQSAPTENTEVPETVPEEPENEAAALGIDVSKYQGVIDWEQVAASGVDFAMIRVGYRTKVNGEITADPTAKYNIQQARKYGVDVGIYFFSTAVTESEAKEEANWIAEFLKDYSISYPVAFNCEDFSDPDNRQYSLSKQQRTDIALAFLAQVEKCGYTPMFYAAKSEMEADSQWQVSRIEGNYLIWVAAYTSPSDPVSAYSGYSRKHDMWQYTANGSVPGIDGAVDLNVAYFTVTSSSSGSNSTEEEEIPWDELMNFQPVNDTVTAKDKTNLRDIPSQDEDSTVLYTLTNGETATRIAISDYGWSKLEFNGNIYYAVSSYLTTDLTPPAYQIQTQFEEVRDEVTAKDVVNLRTLPSVTNEESEVVAQLTHGEIITRTGINEELGWSRVEYNGQTLYCVSQYLMSAEELNEETESTQPQ